MGILLSLFSVYGEEPVLPTFGQKGVFLKSFYRLCECSESCVHMDERDDILRSVWVLVCVLTIGTSTLLNADPGFNLRVGYASVSNVGFVFRVNSTNDNIFTMRMHSYE
jgi:hypothetical protein